MNVDKTASTTGDVYVEGPTTSKPTEEIDVVIDEDGRLRFVWHDALADLVPAGYTCDIGRVSDVEPTADGRWTADMQKALARMTPAQIEAVNVTHWSELLLGPFATRAEALAAERDWLRQYVGV